MRPTMSEAMMAFRRKFVSHVMWGGEEYGINRLFEIEMQYRNKFHDIIEVEVVGNVCDPLTDELRIRGIW